MPIVPIRYVRGLSTALVLATACACAPLASLVDERANQLPQTGDERVSSVPRPTADELAFHNELFIADLHADSLLWDRSLAASGKHVDFQKLRGGNVGLQVLSVVTVTPFMDPLKSCIEKNDANLSALLTAKQGKDFQSWFSPNQPAKKQAESLREEVNTSRRFSDSRRHAN